MVERAAPHVACTAAWSSCFFFLKWFVTPAGSSRTGDQERARRSTKTKPDSMRSADEEDDYRDAVMPLDVAVANMRVHVLNPGIFCEWMLGNGRFGRMGVQGDGSCFFHSVCAITNRSDYLFQSSKRQRDRPRVPLRLFQALHAARV